MVSKFAIERWTIGRWGSSDHAPPSRPRVGSRSGKLFGMVSIRRATVSDAEACVAVLARLPDHFTPDTHDEVRTGIERHVAWVAIDGDEVRGFVLVEVRYPAAAEITFAAVIPERHRGGIGSRLVERAFSYLKAENIALVEAKTLDASAGYEPYVATRAFWEHMGFVQIDCIDPLPGWQPGNPSAIYVASLVATR
jgi:GNAT superfamily N-acetyltransferase